MISPHPHTSRRILRVVFLAVVLLSVLSIFCIFPSLGADVEHSGHDGWTKIDQSAVDDPSFDYTLSAGDYYLDGQVNLQQALTLASGETVTLCLNGNVLNQVGENKRVIEVRGATLILCSCTDIEHKFRVADENDPEPTGLWILDENAGTKDVKGGVITGGNVTTSGNNQHGAGIFIDSTGNLQMYKINVVGNYLNASQFNLGGGIGCWGTLSINKGYIAGNCAGGQLANGGGIGAYLNSIVTITDSKIENNVAHGSLGAGGICCRGGGNGYPTVSLTDVEVTGNRATGANGGGIVTGSATLTLKNVKISENMATGMGGGIYIYTANYHRDSTLKGVIFIKGNWVNGIQNNMHLNSESIKTEELTTGSEIGITMKTPGTFTSRTSIINHQYFFSDSATLGVGATNLDTTTEKADLFLGTPVSTITWNRADGSIPSQTRAVQEYYFAFPTPIERTGYSFLGWSEDGGLTAITEKYRIINTETDSFTAMWKASDSFTVIIPDTISFGTGTTATAKLDVQKLVTTDKTLSVLVKSENNWNMVNSDSRLAYEMTPEGTDSTGIACNSQTTVDANGYITILSTKTAGERTLSFAQTGTAQYAGDHTDTLTFMVEFK